MSKRNTIKQLVKNPEFFQHFKSVVAHPLEDITLRDLLTATDHFDWGWFAKKMLNPYNYIAYNKCNRQYLDTFKLNISGYTFDYEVVLDKLSTLNEKAVARKIFNSQIKLYKSEYEESQGSMFRGLYLNQALMGND